MKIYIAGIVTLILFGCSTADNLIVDNPNDLQYVSGDGTTHILSVSERIEKIEIDAYDVNGHRLSTADSSGKVVVLYVWASWCPPCRAEAPHIKRLQEEWENDSVNVEMIGINIRDDFFAAQRFAKKWGFKSFYDKSGKLLLNFSHLPPNAIPSTIILDKDHHVSVRIVGEFNPSVLNAAVRDISEE